MSRRSRRRGKSSGAGWLGKLALGLILTGVLGAGVLYALVRGYLHSDAFRKFLSETVSRGADLDGQFSPFRWDGLAVNTDSFEATGKGIIKELRVDGIHTEVGVGGVRRGVWEIQGSRAQRLEVLLDARGHAGLPEPRVIHKSSDCVVREKGWLPTEVELQGVEIRDVTVKATLDQGAASADHLKVRVTRDGKDAYRAEIADGRLRLPLAILPEIRLDRVGLRYHDGQVFLTSATASAFRDGRLDASGEWDANAGRYSLEGSVTGLKCEEVFNETWAKRFIGDFGSDFALDNRGTSSVARGHMEVRNGTLTALPVLDALAAYADTRRFRVLPLSDARSDWTWSQDGFSLTNLVLASEGLVRLEGAVTIRGRNIDGTFRLGLAPGTLATIPGAETDVFFPGERGLVWAPLRISGTVDDPKEDLTDRLVAAAGARMFDVIPETGEKVIRFSRSILGDDPVKAVEKGEKIIKEGKKTIREVRGILGDILGSGDVPEPEEKKADP